MWIHVDTFNSQIDLLIHYVLKIQKGWNSLELANSSELTHSLPLRQRKNLNGVTMNIQNSQCLLLLICNGCFEIIIIATMEKKNSSNRVTRHNLIILHDR